MHLSENADQNADKKQMTTLRGMFARLDKTQAGTPQNIQDFLKSVLLEIQKGQPGEEEINVSMDELVDAAKAKYPKTVEATPATPPAQPQTPVAPPAAPQTPAKPKQ